MVRTAPANARRLARANPAEVIQVTLILRRGTHTRSLGLNDLCGIGLKRLTPDAFEHHHGAGPADVHAVTTYLTQQGLSVDDVHAGAKQIKASGPIAVIERTFGVDLHTYRLAGDTFRHHPAPLVIPAPIAHAVTAVIGLDDQPVPTCSCTSSVLRPHQCRALSM
jgi:hypothetical protein